MQTFFNPKTPFFGAEGKPMANARVTFLSVDTSGAPLVVKDFYGNILDNPMTTQSDGTLKDVPYFDDGVSYKVVVEKPTGVPAVYVLDRIVNESELFKPAYEFIVSSMGAGESGLIQATFVDGIVGVRNADKNLGSVVCNGYTAKNDGCPSRVFKWVESVNPMPDNGVNSLRNVNDNTGYWKMEEPQGVFDVRFGGLFPTNGDVDSSIKLSNILSALNQSNVDTIYFPQGEYYFSGNHFVKSMVMENGCNFRPFRGNDAVFNIGNFENRGGRFFHDPALGSSIFPVMKGGILRTSWLNGDLSAFVVKDGHSSGVLGPVKVLVLDDENIEYGSFPGYFDAVNMSVVNFVSRAIPEYIKPSFVLDVFNKTVTAPILKIGGLIINDNRVLYGSTPIFEFDEEERKVTVLTPMALDDIDAANVHAETLKAEKVNIYGTKNLVETDKDYYLSVFDEKHKAGEIVIVHNTAQVQRKVYIRTTNDGTEKRTYCTINANTALMFFCTIAPSTGFSQWSAMSNVSTTTEN